MQGKYLILVLFFLAPNNQFIIKGYKDSQMEVLQWVRYAKSHFYAPGHLFSQHFPIKTWLMKSFSTVIDSAQGTSSFPLLNGAGPKTSSLLILVSLATSFPLFSGCPEATSLT